MRWAERLVLLVAARAHGVAVWLDARAGPARTSRPATAVVVEAGEPPPGYEHLERVSIRQSGVFRGGTCVGRVVAAPDRRQCRSDIEHAVRAGVYELLFLDGPFDLDLVAFALARADHCRAISGVDVRVACSVASEDDVAQATGLSDALTLVVR